MARSNFKSKSSVAEALVSATGTPPGCDTGKSFARMRKRVLKNAARPLLLVAALFRSGLNGAATSRSGQRLSISAAS
jgi:hypothetical protein